MDINELKNGEMIDSYRITDNSKIIKDKVEIRFAEIDYNSVRIANDKTTVIADLYLCNK